MTPLILAIIGKIPIVLDLFQCGADPNYTGEDGWVRFTCIQLGFYTS